MVARQAVLAKAQEWVGMLERSGNNDIWFAEDWGIGGSAWCFAFVQSCFYYADPSPSGKLPYLSMYCPAGIQWARDNGQAIEVEQAHLVQSGDIVFFSWDMNTWGRWTPGTGDHVGIVESYEGGDTIHTIEGNIGSPQGVWRKDRSISETVVNFWRPSVYSGPLSLAPIINPEELTVAQVDELMGRLRPMNDKLDQLLASVTTYNEWAAGRHEATKVAEQQRYEAEEAAAERRHQELVAAAQAARTGQAPSTGEAGLGGRVAAVEADVSSLHAKLDQLLGQTQPRPPVQRPVTA